MIADMEYVIECRVFGFARQKESRIQQYQIVDAFGKGGSGLPQDLLLLAIEATA
jgi:hypothetical protein